MIAAALLAAFSGQLATEATERVTLRFAWPDAATARIVETSKLEGDPERRREHELTVLRNPASGRYELRLIEGDLSRLGGVSLESGKAHEWVAQARRVAEAPGIRCSLTMEVDALGVLERTRATAFYDQTGAEPGQGEAQAADPRLAEMNRTLSTPAGEAALLRVASEVWHPWVGVWLEGDFPSDGESERAVDLPIPELGRTIRFQERRFGGGVVEDENGRWFHARIERTSDLDSMRALLPGPEVNQTDSPSEDEELPALQIRIRFEILAEVETLLPRKVLAILHTVSPDGHGRKQQRRWEFDWSLPPR